MIDEHQIIARVLSGEVDAFSDLLTLHQSHVFKIVANMVASEDVEEVAHVVFIKVFRDLALYKFRSPFEHWIAKIAVRTCYDHWRTRRRQKVVTVSDQQLNLLEASIAHLENQETDAVRRAGELLDKALSWLDPKDRLAFSLLYLEGMAMKDVGEKLGWSVAQVKIRAFRSRQLLRRKLKSALGEVSRSN